LPKHQTHKSGQYQQATDVALTILLAQAQDVDVETERRQPHYHNLCGPKCGTEGPATEQKPFVAMPCAGIALSGELNSDDQYEL
jgi:hypothetical protein